MFVTCLVRDLSVCADDLPEKLLTYEDKSPIWKLPRSVLLGLSDRRASGVQAKAPDKSASGYRNFWKTHRT